MKTICVLALGALVVGCHLDKLIGGSGGPHPTSNAPPAGLVFMAQPKSAQVGQQITPVQVSIVDAAGVPVAGADNATVSVRLGANPGGATLLGDATAKPTRGVATFGNISLDKPGQGYTLIAHVSVSGPPDTTSTPFNIDSAPPTTGNLTVTTSTTGLDLDLDGYTVTVDGNTSQTIASNNSSGVTFPGLPAGNHSVALSGVAPNCSVSGGATHTVAVPAGGTATAPFLVTCTQIPPTTGDLTVTTSTSGSDLDPDGYTVTVDQDQANSKAIATTSGSVTFPALPAGNHNVALSGVASNCTVTAPNPRTVNVTAGGNASTTFTLSCTALPPTTGDLIVTTTTGGSDLDPDGYTATVEGTSKAILTNGSVTFTGLSAGPHNVALSDIASNCTVSGNNPQSASVPAGGQVTTPFAITCTAPPQNHPPVVTAGPDQSVLLSVLTMTLNGASFSDVDHDGPWTVTIEWGDGARDTFTQPSEGSIGRSHTYPLTLLGATYQLTVTVTDAHSASNSASKQVSVTVT